MANLFTLGFGKVSDLMGKLAEAGLTAEMAEEVRKNPALAEVIVNALKQQPAFALVHGLFVKPEAQLLHMRELNIERKWGIPDEAFTKAQLSIPKWPEDRLVVVTLVPYLSDKQNEDDTVTSGVERTFHELWEVATNQQHAKWRWDGYDKAGADRLRLHKGINHEPGLRWEVIDLGCQRNKKSCDVRSAKSSPNAGILAAAALHPQWVKSMDGDKVPYVWLPGYEVKVPDEEPAAGVPRLGFGCNGREIRLVCGWSGDCRSDWAVPSFVRE